MKTHTPPAPVPMRLFVLFCCIGLLYGVVNLPGAFALSPWSGSMQVFILLFNGTALLLLYLRNRAFYIIFAVGVTFDVANFLLYLVIINVFAYIPLIYCVIGISWLLYFTLSKKVAAYFGRQKKAMPAPANAPTPTGHSATTVTPDELKERLVFLKDALEEGLITEEEFAQKRTELLNRL